MNDQTIMPPDPLTSRAADGGIIPSAALTGGNFIDCLEDGEFSRDLHEQLCDLAATLHDVGKQTGSKVKGKVQINIEISHEDAAFRVAADVKVTKPKLPRPRSILWTDEHNRFTRFPPNQGQFFGARSVNATGPARVI